MVSVALHGKTGEWSYSATVVTASNRNDITDKNLSLAGITGTILSRC